MEKPFSKPIGLYFYDGFHTSETQYKAIVEYARFWAKNVIVIVDDWNWNFVREGTWKGISTIRPKNVWFQDLPSSAQGNDLASFWNGLGAFYIS